MMRATSPPTHHPLPLPAPSISRKVDIPEADIPPRKRLLLTAPIPRFEVGGSSAVARQPGSTVARRVDYSFMDTVDASIRASESRTMAAIEVVNLRRDRVALRDEVDTLRRYISSLCTTHEQERVEAFHTLDRSEAYNRALEAQIAVLETQAQPRIYVARRNDYSFVDTVDASIRAFESRTMAAIKVVNLRVSIRLMFINWRARSSIHDIRIHRGIVLLYVMRSEAHNKALEAQIAVLETQAYRHKWQPILYSLLSFIASMAVGLKMPPKRNVATTTTTPMIDVQIKALIAQGVADALAERDVDRSRNGDDSHDSGSDERR
ncbi:hypothetical protein Tco_1164524 [Tanacetum coccineum]